MSGGAGVVSDSNNQNRRNHSLLKTKGLFQRGSFDAKAKNRIFLKSIPLDDDQRLAIINETKSQYHTLFIKKLALLGMLVGIVGLTAFFLVSQ